MSPPRFHLAIPVADLEAARTFYAGLLGCGVGRESDTWIDFDFFGHQVTAHLSPTAAPLAASGAAATDPAWERGPLARIGGGQDARVPREAATNTVDGKPVPVRHFGVILDWQAWHEVAERLRRAGVDFLIEPYVRFRGQVGEQATLFVLDPSRNGLEFKAFKDETRLFVRE